MLKRVLIFAETVTLAHLARCMVIADELNSTGKYEIAVAADDRYNEIFGKACFSRIKIHSISSDYFSSKLRKGSPIYNLEILTAYVKEDLKVIDNFKPDFIVGDFRLSLSISTRLKKIPYANITNAYWSPYAKIYYPIPEISLVDAVGINIAQRLFNKIKPAIFFIHSFAFNQTCKRFGQSPLAYDMREIYTHADYTLYADIESLIPMHPLPDNHLFIGPVLWSAQVDLPEWWKEVPVDLPIIFLTLGSSGDSSLLPMILKTLSGLPVTVLCVTANKTVITQTYKNVFVTKYLPAEIAVKKADIVICNGGSPMVYQTLIENKLLIGIPSNLDQYLMMSIVQDANKGQLIRAGQACPRLITEAVNKATKQISIKTIPLTVGVSLAIDKISALIDAS